MAKAQKCVREKEIIDQQNRSNCPIVQELVNWTLVCDLASYMLLKWKLNMKEEETRTTAYMFLQDSLRIDWCHILHLQVPTKIAAC